MSKTVAVVGASSSRAKFGNKALRAFLSEGHRVLAINPNETEVEGVKTYASVLDVPGPVDMVSLYVPPEIGVLVLEDHGGRVRSRWSPGLEAFLVQDSTLVGGG